MKAQGIGLEILWVILCALGYAFFIICQKFLPAFSKVNIFAFQLLGVIIIVFPFLIKDINNIIHTFFNSSHILFWWYLLIIAVLFTIIPMLLNLNSLAYLPTSTAAIIIYTNPIISFLIGIIIYHETITHLDIYVYSLLVLAVLIFNYPILKKTIKKPS